MSKKLWYFAHPYSDDPPNNFKLANERALKLLNSGYHVFSPITHSYPLELIENHDYEFWMELDELILPKCYGLILAPNWKNSKGCIREFKRATELRMPILEYEKMKLD